MLKNERGSAFIIVSVLLVIVGIFSFNISRQNVQSTKLQKVTNIKRDREQVERYIRIILSNPDLCTKLVKVDTNNQISIKNFEFTSGRVTAYKFQFENVRYILGKLKLANFTYETRCPGMDQQKASCIRPGSIPILYEQDKYGGLVQCKQGGSQNQCENLGGVWQESAKFCDLCLGLGGYWKNGKCAFRR